MNVRFAGIAIAAGMLVLPGCATLDAYSVGRADRLAAPPYVVDYRPGPEWIDLERVLIGPVRVESQRNRADWPSGRARALAPLLDALNARIDDSGSGIRREAANYPSAGAPYLYLGSAESDLTPDPARIDRLFGAKYPAMVLYTEKPSAQWRAQVASAAAAARADYVLWLELGFAEYPKADRGVFGKQAVLGSGYSVPIKFLTAEDKPLEVMQITGLLLDAQGNMLRAGGEGFYASDTPFRYQIVDVVRTIDDEAIAQATRSVRRADLRGAPLAWEAALDMLIRTLTEPGFSP
jgi:hypothetical protein